LKPKTDLDLPVAYRTQANLWKAKFFEMREEVVKANKGIRRLKYKLDLIKKEVTWKQTRNNS